MKIKNKDFDIFDIIAISVMGVFAMFMIGFLIFIAINFTAEFIVTLFMFIVFTIVIISIFRGGLKIAELIDEW